MSDLLDNDSNEEIEEERLFREKYAKQLRIFRKTFSLAFGIVSGLFLVVGSILWCTISGEDGIVGVIFVILGGVFAFLTLICLLVIPTNADRFNYKKYKENLDKESFNYFGDSIKTQINEEKIKKLELRVDNLIVRLDKAEEEIQRLNRYDRML
ncbi:MAG: hypothetical protein RR086_04020 [Clostridia bacterium]